jgi:DNA-binding NarL/FixJ family response regulator
MQELRVLIASAKKVFWEGLIKVLSSRSDTKVIDFCSTGQSTMDSASNNKPNVIFIDEGIKDCGFIELSRSIRNILPESVIFIVISAYPHLPNNILSVFEAGAHFYVDKDITITGINALLDRVQENLIYHDIGYFLFQAVSEHLAKENEFSKTGSIKSPPDNLFGLTKREIEILGLVVKEKSNREIAQTLFITENTVKAHMSSIFEKLHVKTRHEVVPFIKEKGIVRDT